MNSTVMARFEQPHPELEPLQKDEEKSEAVEDDKRPEQNKQARGRIAEKARKNHQEQNGKRQTPAQEVNGRTNEPVEERRDE